VIAPIFYTPHDVRKATVCPRLEPENRGCRDNPPTMGIDYDKADCISGQCTECSDMKRFVMCEAELSVTRPITFMCETTIEYVVQKKKVDGHAEAVIKKKIDFVSLWWYSRQK
jgi:hypothetical protein